MRCRKKRPWSAIALSLAGPLVWLGVASPSLGDDGAAGYEMSAHVARLSTSGMIANARETTQVFGSSALEEYLQAASLIRLLREGMGEAGLGLHDAKSDRASAELDIVNKLLHARGIQARIELSGEGDKRTFSIVSGEPSSEVRVDVGPDLRPWANNPLDDASLESFHTTRDGLLSDEEYQGLTFTLIPEGAQQAAPTDPPPTIGTTCPYTIDYQCTVGTQQCTANGGTCTSGTCTSGSCTSATGCTQTQCTNGAACTAGGECTNGSGCTNGGDCTAGTTCTIDGCTGGRLCTDGGGCTQNNSCTTASSACTSGGSCTNGGTCTNGGNCTSGTHCTGGLSCSSNNACTQGNGGCTQGSKCTGGDFCTRGAGCTTNTGLHACTQSACSNASHCTQGYCTTANKCTDGTACHNTAGDGCTVVASGCPPPATSGPSCSSGAAICQATSGGVGLAETICVIPIDEQPTSIPVDISSAVRWGFDVMSSDSSLAGSAWLAVFALGLLPARIRLGRRPQESSV